MGENSLTGGCQCGAVRFRVDGDAEAANVCHCRMCQMASGQPFMAFARVRDAQFTLTKGPRASFRSSDIVERGFCAACGTPLTYKSLVSDRISFAICALDEPAAIAPTAQLAAEQAVPWLASALAARNIPLQDWLRGKPTPDSRQYPNHE